MTFRTRTTFPEYREVAFKVMLHSWRLRVLIFLFFFSLLNSATELLQPTDATRDPLMQFIVTAGAMLVLVVAFFMIIRRNYYSNARNSELVEYTFTDGMVFVKGESFKSEWTLNKMHKTREMKKWFIIYHDTRSFTFIPKSDLSNEQTKELRCILDNVKK